LQSNAAILDELTRCQREVMLRRLAADGGVVPQEKIADDLGISQPAVSQRLWNGVNRLKARIPGLDVEQLLKRLALN
jgi:biotin operon repressor